MTPPRRPPFVAALAAAALVACAAPPEPAERPREPEARPERLGRMLEPEEPPPPLGEPPLLLRSPEDQVNPFPLDQRLDLPAAVSGAGPGLPLLYDAQGRERVDLLFVGSSEDGTTILGLTRLRF